MSGHLHIVFLCGAAVALQPVSGLTGQSANAAVAAEPRRVAIDRDGQRDFDAHIGTWTTQLKRLQKPLSGSTTWLEYEGTSVVREVMGGRANLVELDVEGPAGRIEGLLLRLYNPASRQWSMHFASIASGVLTPPLVGGFDNGRGVFFAQDTYADRPVLVRFVITDIAADAHRFEQAFSVDDGKTWEVNWIAIDTRMP